MFEEKFIWHSFHLLAEDYTEEKVEGNECNTTQLTHLHTAGLATCLQLTSAKELLSKLAGNQDKIHRTSTH